MAHLHDHDHPAPGCAHAADQSARATEAASRAEAVCAERGARLTPIRRAVLEALTATHRPLGAYEIVEALAENAGRSKRRLAPITVYRALDFLMEQGLVHRLASRNAFVVCPHAHGAGDVVAFLICEACGGVDERCSEGLGTAVRGLLTQERFRPRQQVLEITGLCAHCLPAA